MDVDGFKYKDQLTKPRENIYASKFRNQLVNFLNVTKDDQKTITNTVSYKRKQNQTCFPRCGIEAKFTNKYKSVSLAPVLTYGWWVKVYKNSSSSIYQFLLSIYYMYVKLQSVMVKNSWFWTIGLLFFVCSNPALILISGPIPDLSQNYYLHYVRESEHPNGCFSSWWTHNKISLSHTHTQTESYFYIDWCYLHIYINIS